jgi:SAM-dependent methyltransferase
MGTHQNIDIATVEGFGEEWATYDQTELTDAERAELFERYFGIFPFDKLRGATGFDLGCGSGRWALLAAPRVGTLHAIDPAEKALSVAHRALAGQSNVRFHHAGVDDIPLPDNSQDFGYSLGVLHHIPDTAAALEACVRKLKPGAPFLVYLYYRFDNRPLWFRALWKLSDVARGIISRLPFGLRNGVANIIAALAYWPLARFAGWAEKRGLKVENWPLSPYRNNSFYTMRTDALDRFGTRLEQRFTRTEIFAMMMNAGLENIEFSDKNPYWVAWGRKRAYG